MNRGTRIQRVAGWIIVLISMVHLAVTFVDYDSVSLEALWFVGSGFALLLIGGLNVITPRISLQAFRELRALRILTLVADGCGVGLGAIYIVLTRGSQPQGPILVVLFAIAAVSQLSRRVE